MSLNDAFAPPTDQEIKLAQIKANPEASQGAFAPPSEKELAQAKAPQDEGALQAGLERFGNVATFGHLPELQAGVGSALGLGDFKSLEAENIARQHKLSEAHPYASGAGGALGYGAQALGAGAAGSAMGLPAATGLLGKIGYGAAGGAIAGGLTNPKEINPEAEPSDMSQRLNQAAVSGVAGGILGPLASKVGSKIASSAEDLRQYAQEKMVKAAGPMLRDMKEFMAKGEIDKIANTMRDFKLAPPGSTFSDIAEKAAAAKEAVGKQIGAIYDQTKAAISSNPQLQNEFIFLHPDSLRPELEAAISKSGIRPTLGKDKFDNEMNSVISDILGDKDAAAIVNKNLAGKIPPGEMPAFQQSPEYANLVKQTQQAQLSDPRHLLDVKGDLSDKINWSKRAAELAPNQKGYKAIRDVVYNKIAQLLDKVDSVIPKMAGPNGEAVSDSLAKLNSQYGPLSEISSMAQGRAAREAVNRTLSLTDYMSGLGGMIAGGEVRGGRGMMEGLALGAINKLARTRGNQVLSPMALQASKVAGKLPLAPLGEVQPGTAGLIGGAAYQNRRSQ